MLLDPCPCEVNVDPEYNTWHQKPRVSGLRLLNLSLTQLPEPFEMLRSVQDGQAAGANLHPSLLRAASGRRNPRPAKNLPLRCGIESARMPLPLAGPASLLLQGTLLTGLVL
jgi:hypothetical protein